MKHNDPKIIVIDIETAPYEAFVWGLWDQNVGLEQIKEERTILSYSYKPLGGKLVYADTGGRGPDKVRDDKAICESLWTILDNAEIVIAQNGKKFDLRIINGRMAVHGLPPYSPVRVIDTLQVAKKYFGFSSNKLAWLSKYLTDSPKSEHKDFSGMTLWIECLKDNPKAFKSLRKYNNQDIIATTKLYLKLRPWMDNHPNLTSYHGFTGCPICSSKNVQARGYSMTQGGKYQRFQCQDCGGWSKSKQNLISLVDRKAKLA